MSNDDWYRRKTWTETDQKNFFNRLERSRSTYNKAQYLRIQASALKSIDTNASLSLLEKIFIEYPSEYELASAYLQQAECFEKLGEIDAAIDSFKKCFIAERAHSHTKTMAYIEFAIFVIEHGLSDLLEEANDIIDEFFGTIIFPIDKFYISSFKSVYYDFIGDKERSILFAENAIKNASKTSSGLTYKKEIGLVDATQLL